jgi:hypothetical protein
MSQLAKVPDELSDRRIIRDLRTRVGLISNLRTIKIHTYHESVSESSSFIHLRISHMSLILVARSIVTHDCSALQVDPKHSLLVVCPSHSSLITCHLPRISRQLPPAPRPSPLSRHSSNVTFFPWHRSICHSSHVNLQLPLAPRPPSTVPGTESLVAQH